MVRLCRLGHILYDELLGNASIWQLAFVRQHRVGATAAASCLQRSWTCRIHIIDSFNFALIGGTTWLNKRVRLSTGRGRNASPILASRRLRQQPAVLHAARLLVLFTVLADKVLSRSCIVTLFATTAISLLLLHTLESRLVLFDAPETLGLLFRVMLHILLVIVL